MTNERIAFERWAATKGYDIDVMPAREPQNAGEYYDQTTQDSWVAWQARAAFPRESPAENSPVSKSAPEPAGNRCFACGHPVPPLSPEMQQRLDTALAAFGPMATIHAPGCAILTAAGNPKCSCGAENRPAEPK